MVAGQELSCPIQLANNGNVRLHNVAVQSHLVQTSCTVAEIYPGTTAIPCHAVMQLSAQDFLASYVHVLCNATADLTPDATFIVRVDLDVTRTVSATVLPRFAMPSKWYVAQRHLIKIWRMVHNPSCLWVHLIPTLNANCSAMQVPYHCLPLCSCDKFGKVLLLPLL